ncbi:MAG TPA: polymorphic toxin-type HINT domain-containing protein, partial [Gemmatales bacterium]|nr:polymorphic toxin-type HINT domain-containing protein [Gemmatales bacterium]
QRPGQGCVSAPRILRTTAAHPFWVEGRGWTAVKDLAPGDRLRGHAGQLWPVEAVTPTTDLAAVYNCRIADYHTYFVQGPGGGAWLWAHNACDWKKYEDSVVGLFGKALSKAAKTFGGLLGNRIADHIIRGANGVVAVEAKFIRNWARSIYNSGGWLGNYVRSRFVNQVKDYVNNFDHLLIVSNSQDFIRFAKQTLNAAHVDMRKITFLLVP